MSRRCGCDRIALRRCPSAPVRLARSLPARSTRCIFAHKYSSSAKSSSASASSSVSERSCLQPLWHQRYIATGYRKMSAHGVEAKGTHLFALCHRSICAHDRSLALLKGDGEDGMGAARLGIHVGCSRCTEKCALLKYFSHFSVACHLAFLSTCQTNATPIGDFAHSHIGTRCPRFYKKISYLLLAGRVQVGQRPKLR